MTNRLENAPRRLVVCSGCGTKFGCTLDASCWCADEHLRLPMPRESEDCLCRDCLRKAEHASRREPR